MQDFLKYPTLGKEISIIKTQIVRKAETLYGEAYLTTPKDAAKMARHFYHGADREIFLVCSVDASYSPVAFEVIAIGNLNSCIATPREIFKHAILNNAYAILMFHNHPSGRCVPSNRDKLLTQRIYDAGKLLGICLADHIIVGRQEEDYFSFANENCLTEGKRLEEDMIWQQT